MSQRIVAVALIACLSLGGCSVFAPREETPNARELLTQPITAKKRAEARAEAKKPGWLKSWLTPEEPPPPDSLKDYMKLEPIRP